MRPHLMHGGRTGERKGSPLLLILAFRCVQLRFYLLDAVKGSLNVRNVLVFSKSQLTDSGLLMANRDPWP
ncbi:hypothetical protein CEXT_519311 [Caerostris extrusa]|uniref:Secreted protein n=1 Tax=Caerostris extrusa TaxID=172846 RepID=A0AAV4TGM5_CAEEX|nr:hypothetical protein CEXT_519311 [Caerostris extrusa]